jgi:hypothetical protein
MGFLDGIEKLITEHGSAAVLSQQLSFAKDQFAYLERQVSDLQLEVGRLRATLEREQQDHNKAKGELQRLKDEHFEEIRIVSLVEFRRGKRTGGEWMAFCPKCHMPAGANTDNGRPLAYCTANCGWHADLPQSVEHLRRTITANTASGSLSA